MLGVGNGALQPPAPPLLAPPPHGLGRRPFAKKDSGTTLPISSPLAEAMPNPTLPPLIYLNIYMYIYVLQIVYIYITIC